MSTAGKRLLSAVVHESDLQKYVKLGLTEKLFREGEIGLFTAVNEHVQQYGKIPAIETLLSLGHDTNLVSAPEPAEYYLQEVERRFLRSNIKTLIVDANQLLVDEKDDEAYNLLMEKSSLLNMERNRNVLHDFRDAESIVKSEYKKQVTGDVGHKLTFGWKYLDDMTGGLHGGDICSIVGRPSSGKTFSVLKMAHHSWKCGRVPLIISMEMGATIMMQRLAAMEAKIGLTRLLRGQLSSAEGQRMKISLKKLEDKKKPLWVVDSNMTSTVDDIIMLGRQLNATDIYVDAAYLLKHANLRLSKWDRMSENAELLKQKVAQGLNVPVVLSYQFSKESSKRKKEKGNENTTLGMEDIYGSDAIAQISSVILGMMAATGDIEAQMQRNISVLKGRNGEVGSFNINWLFHNMDFSQVSTKSSYTGHESDEDLNQPDNEMKHV